MTIGWLSLGSAQAVLSPQINAQPVAKPAQASGEGHSHSDNRSNNQAGTTAGLDGDLRRAASRIS